MKRTALLVLMAGLTGCGADLSPMAPETNAPAEAMMFDRFDTKLVISGDYEWTIGVTARSMLGKTFFNNLITVVNGKNAFVSTIRLGKDGGLYVKDFAERVYRVGEYSPANTRLQDDAPFAMRLSPQTRLDIVWGDYIPMGGNVLELEVKGTLTPLRTAPTFLKAAR